MNNILITGGLGFIGSNYIEHLLESKKKYKIINIDKISNVSNLKLNKKFEKFENYKFYKLNINNFKKLNYIFQNHKIDNIINFAAETHVDNSIESPSDFIYSNILGTYKLLLSTYKHWMIAPNKVKSNFKNSKFIHISTDEIYGSIKTNVYSSENDSLYPSSPYSASKASSDHLVYSFFKTFGLKTIITNCTNNYGKYQNKEKLIPKIIYNATNNLKIPIYGDGKQIRDWIHVYDHCKAIQLILKKGKIGERYNISSNEEFTNINVAKIILNEFCTINKKFNYNKLLKFTKDRPGHDFRYALNNKKLKNLGWKPSINFKKGIRDLINLNLNKT